MLMKHFVLTAALGWAAASCGSSIAHPACNDFTTLTSKCANLTAADASAAEKGCALAADTAPTGCDAALSAAAACMKGKSCDVILAADSPCTSTYADVSTLCYGTPASNVFNPSANAAQDNNSTSLLVARSAAAPSALSLIERILGR